MNKTLEEISGQSQTNGWNEWSRHVLLELERLNSGVESLKKEVAKVSIKLAILTLKVSIIAGVAGVVGGFILQLVLIVVRKKAGI